MFIRSLLFWISTFVLLAASASASAQANNSSDDNVVTAPSASEESGADALGAPRPAGATEWSEGVSPRVTQASDSEVPQMRRERMPDRARRSTLALSTTFGGLVGVGGGFALAWGPALGMWGGCKNDSESDFCGLGSLLYMLGSTWLTPATTALGVWEGGRLAGGRGRYDLTLLGAAIGGTFGGGLTALGVSRADSTGGIALSFMAVPAFELVGALVAYHLSNNASFRRRELRVVPSAQAEQGGASLRLMGRF